MNRISLRPGAVSMLCFALASSAHAQVTVVHAFNVTDGSAPWGNMSVSGATLYGTTEYGGTYHKSGQVDGTIFKLNTDGSGFSTLHSFGAPDDGGWPLSGPILADGTLYGTTSYSQSQPNGSIFAIDTDGSGYHTLYSFPVSGPTGELTLVGSTLYGMTSRGGLNGHGTIFSVNTDGTNFSTVHSFTGAVSDGAVPSSGLTRSGTTFYGTTIFGGTYGLGTVFKMNTDGTEFEILHSFGNGADEVGPEGTLALSGSTLYGTTTDTIFKVNTDGSDFSVLHTLSGNAVGFSSDLVISGSKIFGSYGAHVVEINTDGTDYSVIANIGGTEGMTLVGSTLFVASRGDAANGGNAGAISSIAAPEPSTVMLLVSAIAGLFLYGTRLIRTSQRQVIYSEKTMFLFPIS
jgi:uncharacterized repeat protein (TIGR03803 family)